MTPDSSCSTTGWRNIAIALIDLLAGSSECNRLFTPTNGGNGFGAALTELPLVMPRNSPSFSGPADGMRAQYGHWTPRTPRHWPPRRRLARRQRVLAHAGQSKLPRYRPLTPAFSKNRSPYTPVDLHLVHPSGVPRSRPSAQRNRTTSVTPQASVLRETKIRRSTFTPPHHAPLPRRNEVYFYSGAHDAQCYWTSFLNSPQGE